MGRKCQSKKSHGKESNKYKIQKRKDLAVVVDHLLKLTSIFQANVTPAKSWEHHQEIESLLKHIQKIETPKVKKECKPRQTNIDQFLKWLKENGAQFEGTEISQFENYDLGLKASNSFTEGTLLLTVPRKVMMTEKDAQESELAEFIRVDPLLQNMPNITLALFLLMEKDKIDSFWKPYIDILPEKYSTILYFTSQELAELKPSPVLDSSLKLYRSIARQYSYFYNKIQTMDLPVLKTLQDIFTFENYRWAVSTVMTRQNNVKLSGSDTTAFIPLWDMCNHEQGKLTTDFNDEQNRGECYALRDFKAGEQIFIFYGARPNCDLFLHNGFVYPKNAHDSLTLCLGVSSSDQLRDQRLDLLRKLGLSTVTHYHLYTTLAPLSPELLAFIRIFNMDQDELTKWSTHGVPSDLVSSEPSSAEAVGAALDRKAYKYLLTRCSLVKASYANKSQKQEESDFEALHINNIRLLKQCEVNILEHTIKYLEDALAKLPAEGN